LIAGVALAPSVCYGGQRVKLRTYQAYSMAEALAAVKRDLGSDAIILNTRSFKRGGLLGLARRTVIELTATAGDATTPRAPGGAVAPRSRGQHVAPGAPGVPPAPAPAEPVEIDHVALPPRAKTPAGATPPRPRTPAPADRSGPGSPRRYVLTPAGGTGDAGDAGRASGAEGATGAGDTVARTPVEAEPKPDVDSTRAVQDELVSIRRMVGAVLQRQTRAPGGAGVPRPDLPEHLADVYLALLEQEMSDELVDHVITEVRAQLDETALTVRDTVRAAAKRAVARLIPVASDPLPRPADGRPLTVALVGPTGVGKTTTLAKLAASFKLRHQARVGLVTADTYRIAAVDQLRTYAGIIGVPLKVVLTPDEMERGLRELRDFDVILIDTAGRSQNDADRLGQLQTMVHAADPHAVHLVLSATAGEKVLRREADAFRCAGYERVVLTKLDEAAGFGTVITVLRDIEKHLSFVTTGQEVPNHLEIACADRLATLVLGGSIR